MRLLPVTAALLASAATLSLGVAAAEAKTVTITSAAKPVTLKVGDKLVVRVAENPSTGYSWKTVKKPVFLKLLSTSYKADPAPAGTVGGGGRRTFTYSASAKGSGTLSLLYRQSFAPNADPSSFKVKVTVK